MDMKQFIIIMINLVFHYFAWTKRLKLLNPKSQSLTLDLVRLALFSRRISHSSLSHADDRYWKESSQHHQQHSSSSRSKMRMWSPLPPRWSDSESEWPGSDHSSACLHSGHGGRKGCCSSHYKLLSYWFVLKLCLAAYLVLNRCVWV